MNQHESLAPSDAETLHRRRRARSALPFLGHEEQDRALESLAERALPGLGFYLYALLAGILIGFAYALSSPVLLILAVVAAPLLTPLVGLAIGTVTVSPSFALRSLAALAVAAGLAFSGSLAAIWIGAGLSGGRMAIPLVDVLGILVAMAGSAWWTVESLRESPRSWIPNAGLAFLFLSSLAAAAANLLGDRQEGFLPALGVAGIYLALMFAASVATFFVFGFQPPERGWRTVLGLGIGFAPIVIIAAIWMAGGGSQVIAGKSVAASPTPTATEMETASPVQTPTITYTPTRQPTFTETAVPSPTFTPTFMPVAAVVSGTGGQGAFLRDAPNGKAIASLADGDAVTVLGTAVTQDGTDWLPVRDKLGNTGWMAAEFCSIVTPTPQAIFTATP